MCRFLLHKAVWKSALGLVVIGVIENSLTFADSVTIRIGGTVNPVAAITPGTPSLVQNEQLTKGATDLPIVSINERSNKKSGYTVVLESGNAGGATMPKLLGQATGDVIPYTIKYGDKTADFVNGRATVTDANDKTASAGSVKTLSISIPSGRPAADTYSDTLTLTLIQK